MASTFFGLNIAMSGIYASQAGLKTTGHNISNEHTEGYSRQEINTTASEALRAYASYGMIGSGVSVTGIERIRDAYYDTKYRSNETKLQDYTAKNTYTLQIEDYFNEVQTEGYTTQYQNMITALKSIQGSPDNLTYRAEFLSYAQSVADYFNEIQTNLTSLQKQCNTEVSNMTDKINTMTAQIASLTKQINSVEMSGVTANDLRDKRDLIIDELSGIIPVETKETKTSMGKTYFTVSVKGFTLVDDYDAHPLKLVARDQARNTMDEPNLYDIYYDYDEQTGSGTRFDVQSMGLSGELKATLDIRDGNNGVKDPAITVSKEIKYKGVPYYVKRLQDFKQTLADTFNDVHQNTTRVDENGNTVAANYNLYGNSTKDIPIFVVSTNGVLSVNQDLMDDPNLLAASKYPITDGEGDGSLISDLLKLDGKASYNNSTAKEYLESIVTEISIDVKKSGTFTKNYSNIKLAVSNQRMSVSGVDSDEEDMNLAKYQEAFELASKMIQVMQQIYDKLINETGI